MSGDNTYGFLKHSETVDPVTENRLRYDSRLEMLLVRSCIVSVSHVFLAGPGANATLPDYQARWRAYLALMKPALAHVRAWYPSDEPDLRMPVLF
jgi:hypothetical protein|eukprot:COSAG01_NODE_8366_length_2812_cov_29.171028_2_plen_95_part_00